MKKKSKSINQVVGENITKYRTLKGISSYKLAIDSGYSAPSTLYSLEAGKGGISLEKLEKIASLLEVEVTDLLQSHNSDLSDEEKLKNLSKIIMASAKEMNDILNKK